MSITLLLLHPPSRTPPARRFSESILTSTLPRMPSNGRESLPILS